MMRPRLYIKPETSVVRVRLYRDLTVGPGAGRDTDPITENDAASAAVIQQAKQNDFDFEDFGDDYDTGWELDEWE